MLRNFWNCAAAISSGTWAITLPRSKPKFAAMRRQKVFLLVSGGVDSTVAFELLNRALGPERVLGCISTRTDAKGRKRRSFGVHEPGGIP